MTQAKTGDTVTIGFTVKISDGQTVAATEPGKGETLVLGAGTMFPALEEQIVGMAVGETKTAQVPSDKAFGPRNPDAQFDIERAQLPQGQEPAVGMQLQTHNQQGQPMLLTIIEVTDAGVKVDANHPLAGQDLTFEIEVLDLQAA
ncbi:MAG: peptidylprolyl isomerase [Sphingomonadales bacterium]|nr:MAG: peptidylprolyl isomerase [Sphingomonadales bacterium]